MKLITICIVTFIIIFYLGLIFGERPIESTGRFIDERSNSNLKIHPDADIHPDSGIRIDSGISSPKFHTTH